MTDAGSVEHPSLDVFVARQPIFDRRSELYGYELLFRSSLENQFDAVDQDQASLTVIANSFFVFGIETLTGRGRAFINFARSTLLNDYAYVLPRERLVVEILEDVEPDAAVLDACRRLKRAGYVLALDDFDQRRDGEALLDLADIVKIDFSVNDEERRARYVQQLRRYGVSLLAEKVETRDDFEQAMRLGYSYLQGYFFARPEIRVGRGAPGLRANRLQIMHELHRPDPDLRLIEDQFKHDPALAYKLLRYLNSAAFSLRDPVRTVGQAITYLGQSGMRTWATVMILADLGSDQPFELVVTSVVRGRFCELVGRALRIGDDGQDLFLMGLFSLIDAITGRPLEDALTDLPLVTTARQAILGEENTYRTVLDLTQAYERANWPMTAELSRRLGLSAHTVAGIYLGAVAWGNQVGHIR